MKKTQYQSVHLGAYIAELQHAVPVDGKLLSEADLARRAHMSKTTVENVKKGSKSICMLTATSFTSIWRPAVIARFSRWSVSSTGSTGVWRPTAGPATTADAVALQRKRACYDGHFHLGASSSLSCFFRAACDTLPPGKPDFI